MGRYFLEIRFDGANYHGWQIQENAVSVQEVIDNCLRDLTGDPIIRSVGCGRTDTGVHASQFFLHFDTDFTIVPDLVFRLNRYLPDDIVCISLKKVDYDLHARFSALERTYQYHIVREKNPFEKKHSWLIFGNLDVASMNMACAGLLGEQDFSSFSRAHTQTKTNLCTVKEVGWQSNEEKLIFTITANRFLRNMVRAIVGTLVDVGKGNLAIKDISKIIEAKDRSQASKSAPAQGLFLTGVKYPTEFYE